MPYDSLYTNVDNVARKLKGRLYFGASPHIGGQVVDPELISQVLEQKEAYVNAILRMIYVLYPRQPSGIPALINNHPMISEIVEGLTISELLMVNFQGITPPGESVDVSSAAINSRRQAELLLQMLTVGHNIYIPGLPPVSGVPGISTPQPVVLPGEQVQGDHPDTITKNVTAVSTRAVFTQRLEGIYFGPGDICQRRARGAEPLANWRLEGDGYGCC